MICIVGHSCQRNYTFLTFEKEKKQTNKIRGCDFFRVIVLYNLYYFVLIFTFKVLTARKNDPKCYLQVKTAGRAALFSRAQNHSFQLFCAVRAKW